MAEIVPETPTTGAEDVRWDLTDLYAIEADLDAARREAAGEAVSTAFPEG